MVLEHQSLLSNLPNSGLQPALQLYAAAAAQLGPRNRVPPWAPFLQFGVPGVFGGPFLTRPRFGPQQTNGGGGNNNGDGNGRGNSGNSGSNSVNNSNGCPSGLAGLNLGGMSGNQGHNLIVPRMQGPPSEDSNEDHGKFND